MLRLDVRIGETLTIGDATVKVVKKYGSHVSLAIEAPKEVKIHLDNTNGSERRTKAGAGVK